MTKQLTAEDIAAAFAEASVKPTLRCNVGNVIAENPALEGPIMDVERYSAPTVQRVLKSLGLDAPSSDNISKHRRGVCRCPKED